MKFLFAVLLLTTSLQLSAQVQYETSKDPENGLKTLKGILSPEILQNDEAFTWMKNDISWYKPNADCVANLTAVKDTVQFIVFIGTWCEDSHNVYPQFLKLLNQVGFDKKRLTIVGVDRNKTTLGSLCQALNVTKAPTILVLKAGKEIGRVEEYGKYGVYDKELAEVLAKAK
ncbi:thioredoxin [Lacibacter cauensis]|uniref:Thioredoxin n=1 Tax=Lacibacter cauensis TaxID=510947 RepID=A0A562SR81_9BACT|nr:thioredoxin family protein [Lacibacter cauensis]TWI83524.1 thioredoxin [Lacibacter cauensis]